MSAWFARRLLSLVLIAAAVAAAPVTSAQTFAYDGFVSLRGITAGGPATWLEHGPGRLDASRNRFFTTAQLGGDWFPSSHFDAHVQLLARDEPSGYGGRRAGVVEAWAEATAGAWQLRAGQFFLPTSRENTDPLWTSPYTITLSALNTWIGQELRPLGADLQWKNDYLTIAGTAFRGNDANGTMLGWRGWSLGNRLSVYGEKLPLPPLPAFPAQRDGSTAFGRDLDGRAGFAGRVRWSLPERASVQWAYVDNRGDRRLHDGEYAWQSRFSIVSAQAGSRDSTMIAGEYSWGKTGMGFAPAAFVQADVYTGYLLVSQKISRSRISGRLDVFATIDRDHSTGGNTTEHGRAWTLAWLYDVTPHVRASAEFVQVTGHRDASFDARSVVAELRYALR